MPTQKIYNEHKQMMDKVIDFLSNEYKSLRTGRASTGLVEHLKVEYYGTMTPLNQMATISAPDPASIVIKPFDPSSAKDVEKAIKNSDLSISPISDGKIIRLNLPPLSQERRDQLVAQAKQMAEQAKVSIRNIRRDANKKLDDEEKAKDITEDDRDKGKKDIDELTKEYTDKVDKIAKSKADEISES